MSDRSNIEWTEASWNPVVGCSVISPGCTNCYAMKMAGRLEAMGSAIYRGHTVKTKSGYVWNGKVSESNWGQVIKPLSWKKPRRIFVNSMSDLFHDDMPAETIERAFAVMAIAGRHTFQLLTKRPERASTEIVRIGRSIDILERHARDMGHTLKFEGMGLAEWPLPNVWLGVSAEDQEHADERIPILLDTPAAVRWISAEPLLGPLDLGVLEEGLPINAWLTWLDGLDWVVCGGESGPGSRPMDIEWTRSLRDQCQAAGVPFFMKQLSGPGGRAIKDIAAFPEDLRIREYPGRE